MTALEQEHKDIARRAIGEVGARGDFEHAKRYYSPEVRDRKNKLEQRGPEGRRELLQFLVSLGATSEDLVAYRDELPGLASVLAIRGGASLTLEEAAQRSGVPADKLRRINRVAGFPDPGPEDRVFGENF